MPPARTAKKNQSVAKSNSLVAYGSQGKPTKESETTNAKSLVSKPEDSEKIASPSMGPASPTTAAAQRDPASTTMTPKKEPTKPLMKGERKAYFQDDRRDWDEKYHLIIGTSTKKHHVRD